MSSFDSIDSWFEKGFRVRQQGGAKTASGARRDAMRSRGGAAPAKRGSVSMSAGAKSANIKSVIRKAPEVMVKITGHSKGMRSAGNHLDYISRNGEVELVNESGESIKGRAEVKDLTRNLRDSQIPEESKKREFLHVIFSMPPGTDEKAVRQAVAEFCQEEFSNRRYVMAQHHDTDHNHVHVCVGTRDIDRADEPRLSPRKNDLFRWRLGFADKLREQGVDAAASERRARFQYSKAENSAVRQIRNDNPKSAVFDVRRASERATQRAIKAMMRPENAFVGPLRPPREPRIYEALKGELKAAVAARNRPANPAEAAMNRSRQQALDGWSSVAENLDRVGDIDLAHQVRGLMRDGEAVPVTRAQALYDLAIQRLDQTRAGNEIEQER